MEHRVTLSELAASASQIAVEGRIMRHVPTGLTVVIKDPMTLAQLREAHGTLMGLVRFAGRHDDRSISV